VFVDELPYVHGALLSASSMCCALLDPIGGVDLVHRLAFVKYYHIALRKITSRA
jgi:hypothetical protein